MRKTSKRHLRIQLPVTRTLQVLCLFLFCKDDSSDEGVLWNLLNKGEGDIFILKMGETWTIFDGIQRRGVAISPSKILEGKVYFSKDYITFSPINRKDSKLLTEWGILMLSKSNNDDSSLVRLISSVKGLLHMVRSYSEVFPNIYGIEFAKARISDIVMDMLST